MKTAHLLLCLLAAVAAVQSEVVVRSRTPVRDASVTIESITASTPTQSSFASELPRELAHFARAQPPTLAQDSGLAVTFAKIFGSHMVLQRSSTTVVWGFVNQPLAPSSAKVTVTFGSATFAGQYSTVNSNNSTVTIWWTMLNIPTANATPQTLAVSLVAGSSSAQASLSDLLVGDVFVCGGQSNMQFTVSQEVNGTQSIASGINYPNIRLFTVGQATYSSQPLMDFASVRQPWVSAATKGALGDTSLNWQYFSAVCWETGKNIYDKNQIPLGLVSNNWGGTIIQAWMDEITLKNECTDVPPVPSSSKAPNQPSLLFNAMTYPMFALSVSGMLWYQAEQNVGFAGGAEGYACLFPVFIKYWQQKTHPLFPNQPLPFIFVQLSSYNSNDDLPLMRYVQVNSTIGMPNVAYAISIDIGNPHAAFGDIHPDDKITLGKRLFYAVMNVVYGDHRHSYKGPTPAYIARNETGLTIGFASHSMFPNVDLRKSIYSCGTPPIKLEDCAGFEVSVGGKWTKCASPVQQSTSGSGFFFIDCSIPAGTPISQVRYMWADWGLSFLYNRGGLGPGTDGLPAEPFWEVVPQN